jgi:hypothetical protein
VAMAKRTMATTRIETRIPTLANQHPLSMFPCAVPRPVALAQHCANRHSDSARPMPPIEL